MLSRNLEQTLHRALSLASERRHEYATLEHLLLGLAEDTDAATVLKACGVDLDKLRNDLTEFLDKDLAGLATDRPGDPKPTAGFQRVVQRAAIHVQSSGRDEVTGANVLVALFSERESHAVYFLQLQDMTRLDAVNFISHGIAKAPGRSAQRPVAGTNNADAGRQPAGAGARGKTEPPQPGRAVELLREPEQEGDGRQDRPADRPRPGNRADHPDPVPPHQEQSAVCRRSRRRQDRDRRGPGQAHRRGRRAGSAAEVDDLRARHGLAAGRHPLSRRLRGAAEGGGERTGEPARRHPVHRRDPHRDRRRRDQRRGDGRLQPAEAGAGLGQPALHRQHHLQGIPQLLREGPRAGPPLPEDRRQRAVARGQREDPARPEAELREAPQGPLHRRGDPRRGGAVGEVHQRPQAAGQGDRRDRRGRRLPDAAAGAQAPQDGHPARRRGDRGEDRADSAQDPSPPTTRRRCAIWSAT